MTRIMLALTALWFLIVPCHSASADQGERTDNAETIAPGNLRGTWVAVSMESGGRKEAVPMGQELVFSFDGGKLLITEGKHTEEGAYKTNETRSVKEIDLIPPKSVPADRTIKGIYQVQGDTLKLAFTRGGTRPTGFNGNDAEGGVIIFKRKK